MPVSARCAVREGRGGGVILLSAPTPCPDTRVDPRAAPPAASFSPLRILPSHARRLPSPSVASIPVRSVAQEDAAGDAVLVADAALGSDRAFAALYRRHARYVAGVVYRILGSDAELDDVVQETFCDASNALGSLKDPAGLRAWLARIAVRRIHKRLAKRRRWRWFVGQAEHMIPTVSDPAMRQAVDALYEALDDLPPKLRIPWTLHTLEGETLPDVASACEISLATAKRRIAQAAERIERKLK
jgi:RNA polymerase sigma-70 factor, ECF subfamily